MKNEPTDVGFFMFRKLIVCYEIILYNINHESIKNINLLWGWLLIKLCHYTYAETNQRKSFRESSTD